MTFKPIYLYIILLVLLAIVYIYSSNCKPKSKENFRNLNLPSFKEYMKYSQGYQCDSGMDKVPNDLKDRYNLRSFCDEYPDMPTLEQLSTKLLDGPVQVNSKQIRKIKASYFH